MESSIVNLAVVDAVRLSGIDFGKQKTIDTCAIGSVKIVLKIICLERQINFKKQPKLLAKI